MRHLSAMHTGRIIDEEMCAALISMQRSICADAMCRGLRITGRRHCPRCRAETSCRPPQPGDIIAGTANIGPIVDRAALADSAPPASYSGVDSGAQFNERWRGVQPVASHPALPVDFSTRTRRLSHNSAVHVPLSLRLRVLRVTRQSWNRMADGDPTWARLEESRTKLLLGSLPHGAHATHEIEERLVLWEAGHFDDLLRRAEEQHVAAGRLRGRKRRRCGCSATTQRHAERGKRVQRLAMEGAYRKAVASADSELMEFTAEEDKRLADELLPRSARTTSGLFARPNTHAANLPSVHDERGGPSQVDIPVHATRTIRWAASTTHC